MNELSTEERVKAKLQNLFEEEPAEPNYFGNYRKAAAVLEYFNFNDIKPVEDKNEINSVEGKAARNRDRALESLYDVSEVVYDENRQPQRSLTDKCRREVLETIFRENGIKGFQNALSANPSRPQSTVQNLFESYLQGNPQSIKTLSRTELVCASQIANWLHGVVDNVPAPADIRGLIEIQSLLTPFKYLLGVTDKNTGGSFFGRQQEIEKLYTYVGVNDISSSSQGLIRGVKNFFNFTDKPPLVIHAPGGTGKSTLIAKFVLDHARYKNVDSGSVNDERFPFVYLDFDKPAIKPEEPITLLLEAVQQLAVQYPEHRGLLSKMRDEWLRKMEPVDRPRSGILAIRAEFQVENRQAFIIDFANVVNNLINTKNDPILFLLDTFEEAQWRSRAFVEGIFKFLEDLQKHMPKLRTVISGRSEVKSAAYKQIENYPLPPFDPSAAQKFLEKNGVDDSDISAEIAEQVGGNPLTLRLAARLYELNEVDNKGIKDLDIKKNFFERLKEESIQAMLYRRILEHIHSDDVRSLANPGLILRRITPELIYKVLADPCKIKVPDLGAAEKLFDDLKREITLVSEESAHVLVHRRDVRNLMLNLLKSDKTIDTEKIHQNAVSYYEKFEDDESRSEEIYHRLSLDWNREQLNERWRTNLRITTEDILELPQRSQGYLAAHMQIEVDDSVWNLADFEDWERYSVRSARELINADRPDDALAIIQKREDWRKSEELRAIEREIKIKKNQLKEFEGEGFTKTVFKKMSDWYAPETLFNTARAIISSFLGDKGATASSSLTEEDYFDYTSELSRTIDDFKPLSELGARKEIWIDYVADVGDGWNSTYSVAYNLAKPDLPVEQSPETLKTRRGEILIFGGDLVYPTADMQNYRDRLIVPYQMAFKSTGKIVKTGTGDFADLKKEPHVFALPGSHDWADNLYGFKKIFCSLFYNNRSFAGAWHTRQQQSYFALRLPQKWWLLGFDLHLGQNLDENQLEYFESLCQQMSLGDKVILCVQDPYWVRDIMYQSSGFYTDTGNGSIERLEDFLARRGISVNIYLAGGLHHYRRFENTEGVQKITAGGGGGFLHPTHDFDFNNIYKSKQTDENFILQTEYPQRELSRRYDWQLLSSFIIKNPRFGFIMGVVYTMLAWLIQVGNIYGSFTWQVTLTSTINGLIGEPLAVFFLLSVLLAFVFFTDSNSKIQKYVGGFIHGVANFSAIFVLSWLSFFTMLWLLGTDTFGFEAMRNNHPTSVNLIWFGCLLVICTIGGYIIGSLIMGVYLFISIHIFKRHNNEAFSALKIEDYKNFLRMHISSDGTLTIYPLKIDRVARKWKPIFEYFEPADGSKIEPELIENPIVIK